MKSKILLRSFILLTLLGLTVESCTQGNAEIGEGESFYEVNPPVIRHTYLTWAKDDTSHTMTVNYKSEKSLNAVYVYYDSTPRYGDLSQYKYKILAAHKDIANIDRRSHFVTLEKLKPATTYYFTISDGVAALDRERQFKTLPSDSTPLRFIQGGDMNTTTQMAQLHRQVVKYNPMFAIVGGDIAYDNGLLESYTKWDNWLNAWQEYMETSEGNMIPLVLAIGNEDVNEGRQLSITDKAPFYFGYFHQDEDKSYFTRHFGSELVLFVLDSGHVFSHESQIEWLKAEFEMNKTVPRRVAVYHVPLYPSHRDFDDPDSFLGRTHWQPLFDKYHLQFAFESHDHALKRTKPILDGKIQDGGTVYVGDGCWGQAPRPVHPERWFIEEAQSVRHVWIGTVGPSGFDLRAIDTDGKVVDLAHYP